MRREEWSYTFCQALNDSVSWVSHLPHIPFPSVLKTDITFYSFPIPIFPHPPLLNTILQCLKLLYLIRQQLEEIRLKQEQQEISSTKRRKENKEQNQGESAEEKSRPRIRIRDFPTYLAYRNRNREKEVSEVLWLFLFCRKMGWND